MSWVWGKNKPSQAAQTSCEGPFGHGAMELRNSWYLELCRSRQCHRTQSLLALQGQGLVFPVQQRIGVGLETEKPLRVCPRALEMLQLIFISWTLLS